MLCFFQHKMYTRSSPAHQCTLALDTRIMIIKFYQEYGILPEYPQQYRWLGIPQTIWQDIHGYSIKSAGEEDTLWQLDTFSCCTKSFWATLDNLSSVHWGLRRTFYVHAGHLATLAKLSSTQRLTFFKYAGQRISSSLTFFAQSLSDTHTATPRFIQIGAPFPRF